MPKSFAYNRTKRTAFCKKLGVTTGMIQSMQLSLTSALQFTTIDSGAEARESEQKKYSLSISLPLTPAGFDYFEDTLEEYVDEDYVFEDLVLRDFGLNMQTGGLFLAEYTYSFERVRDRVDEQIAMQYLLPDYFEDPDGAIFVEDSEEPLCWSEDGFFEGTEEIVSFLRENLTSQNEDNFTSFSTNEEFWVKLAEADESLIYFSKNANGDIIENNPPLNQRLANASQSIFDINGSIAQDFLVSKISYKRTLNWIEPKRIGESVPFKRILSSVNESSSFGAEESYLTEQLEKISQKDSIRIRIGNSEGEYSCKDVLIGGTYNQITQDKTADEIPTLNLQLTNKIV